MIKVTPIQTKEEQEKYCGLCGIKYDPDCLAYGAYIDEEFVGACQFRITKGGGVIRDIRCMEGKYDFDTLFIMGRAALNFIDLCGVHNAFCTAPVENKEDERLLLAIGFKKDTDGKYAVDLNGFFEHPCSH